MQAIAIPYRTVAREHGGKRTGRTMIIVYWDEVPCRLVNGTTVCCDVVPCRLVNGTIVFCDEPCRLVNGIIVFCDVVPCSLVNGSIIFCDVVPCSLANGSIIFCDVVPSSLANGAIVSLSPISIVSNLVCPEDGSGTFARNVCTFVPNYAASHRRRLLMFMATAVKTSSL
jgi:hypothetical protein